MATSSKAASKLSTAMAPQGSWFCPGVAGNFPCAKNWPNNQLPLCINSIWWIFIPSFPLEICCIQRARTETLWPRGFQRNKKKHNIKHHVLKEISPLHFSSSRPPVGSIDTATSALPTQRSAASVAHCYAARLPTSATVPRYFSLKRHRLLAQASCHLWPTHVTMVCNMRIGENLPVTKGHNDRVLMLLLKRNGTHAWPSSKKLSKPCQEKIQSFANPKSRFQPAMLMVTATPKLFGEKKQKLWNSSPGRFRWNQSKHLFHVAKKIRPIKLLAKWSSRAGVSPRTPKTSSLHTCKTFSCRRRCFRPGHPQHQPSPMSVFSHFVGKWNGVNCTTALAMPGFGQSSASSALPSSALPLGEGLSGIPSQFPTFAT